jgi:hypothetical protein
MTFKRLSLAALGLTALAITFILANAEPHGRIFWHLLSTHDLAAGWLMLAMLVLGQWLGGRNSAHGAWVERLLLALDRQRHVLALGLWLALCAGSLWVYHDHPLSMDEYAAVFQAKVFAAGAMHGHFPPDLLDQLIPPAFQNHFLMVNRHTGAVFSAYWPGFAILLTPFEWLGIPWACNPTIVAASLLLIGRIARELIASPLAAAWALLFALASPAFVANGITYYSMPAHLLFNLGFAWLLLALSPLRLFLAGLVGGFALVLHNPFPHAVFALPWIIWLGTRRGDWLRNLAWLGAGYLPMVLVLGVGWSLWQQQALREGAAATTVVHAAAPAAADWAQRAAALVSGLVRFFRWPDETILYARLGGLAKLWLWASPLLLLLAWLGGRTHKKTSIQLLGASALLTFFAYFTIPFDQGHGWGYRYFHSAWGALPILAALGAVKLAASAEGSRASQQLLLLTLLSLVIANGLRLAQMSELVASHLAQFPPRVEGERRTMLHNGRGYYARDLIQNDPWLRGRDIVFLASPGHEGEALKRYLAGKTPAASNRYGTTYVDHRESPPASSEE